jgi:hypothetical protein
VTTVNELTARELKEVEVMVGKPIGAIMGGVATGDLSSLGVDVMVAFVWITERRDNPGLDVDTVWGYGLDELAAKMNGAAEAPKVRAVPNP